MIIEDLGIQISFQHLRDDEGAPVATKCKVVSENKTFVAESRCSVKDQFCYEKGRKLALARAMTAIPRDKRIIIWDNYRRQKEGGRWKVAQ